MRRGRERGIRAILRAGAGLSRQRAAGKPKSPDRHDDRSGTLLEHANGTLNRLVQGWAAPYRQNAGEFFPAFCFPQSDTFRLQKTGIPIQRNSFYTISFPAKGFGEEAAWR